MLRQDRRKWALATGLLLICATLSYVRAEKPDSSLAPVPRIISPPNRAVLLSGNVQIIAQSPDGNLALDGKPCQCEPFASPLCVAQVWLDPGLHELRAGDQRTEFVVALNELEHDGPRDWEIYRFHSLESGERRCGDCHKMELEGDLTRVTGLPSDAVCVKCHEKSTVRSIESHQVEPLGECRTCHAIHGSRFKGLLTPAMQQSLAKTGGS